MHPLLADRKKLALYLLAWIPVAVLLARTLASGGGLGWSEAAALAAPMAALYAFVCLSAFYVCRFLPASRDVLPLMAANLAAAAGGAGFWAISGRVFAAVLHLETQYSKRETPVFGTGMLLYLLAAAFYYVLSAMAESREAQARESEARTLAREAELRALRAQVNPHFLFNSLHSIAALAGSDPGRAREMCMLLSDFLRASLSFGDQKLAPLSEELALAQAYLAIEQVRFGPRLRVEQNIPEEVKSWPVPPLLLQPLVENAVGHGVATTLEGGVISISAQRTARGLLLAVENDYDPDEPPRPKNGLGLENVRRRLAARYGRAARLDVLPSDRRFRVELLIPAEQEMEP